MKLSLCLEMLFTDRPFNERLHVAWHLGYRAFEFWDWRDKDLPAMADRAAQFGLTVAAMSGNRKHALIDPAARSGLFQEMDQVFAAAKTLSCRNIMMLSDVLNNDGSAAPVPPCSDEEKVETMVESLRALSERAADESVTLLLEPLNTVLDHRGCFLDHSAPGFEVVRRVGSPHVKLLYDIYHMSMMEEDVLTQIDENLKWIGYIHVADKPGRHQPGSGKINYREVNALLKQAEYEGYVGMEFSPLGPDEQAAQAPLETFK
jgi:hydroxypyruvate isomerase